MNGRGVTSETLILWSTNITRQPHARHRFAAFLVVIVACETKNVRLLCLGMPIANRIDAIRVAEEYVILDVISRGRLEMGFVKGAPFEVATPRR